MPIYRSEYDPITKKTKQVILDDKGNEIGTYGAGGDVYNNPVQKPFTQEDGNASEIIGAGPNAGMTAAEVVARDAANPNWYAENFVTEPGVTGGVQPGETLAQAQARISGRPFITAGSKNTSNPTLSAGQSEKLKKDYGLIGFDYSFAGLTSAEAEAKAQKLQKEKQAQTSSLTSYEYNPNTIAGTKKAVDNLTLKLNEVSNSPWTGNGSKADAINTQLAVTTNDIAKNWTDVESFLKDFNTNPDIQKNLQGYLNAGGTKEKVIESINNNNMELNTAGKTPTDKLMSTEDYLATMTPEETKARQEVVNKLVPELNLAQDEITRIAGIPTELKDLYFGTPEKIGLLEKKEIEAKEAKRILEEKERDAQTSLREKAQIQLDKNKADLRKALATTEKNRLNSKNYMTGMLAKLGALNTSSAAPIAIAELDQKYEEQAQELQSEADINTRTIETKLNSDLNDIENQVDEKILAIEQDLSKDNETIAKEIMKAQQTAQKEIYAITNKYSALIRTETDKNIKAAKTAAEKYAKDYAKIASTGVDLSNIAKRVDTGDAMEGDYIVSGKTKGFLQPDGSIKAFTLTPTEQKNVEGAKVSGEDTVRYFITLPTAFQDYWQQLIISSGDPTSRYNLQAVKTAYDEWSKKKTTKTITPSSNNALDFNNL